MNDSSWGAPQGAYYWGTSEIPAAPAGPAHDAHGAQQTRPMPIVPDTPDAGRDDADDHDGRDGGATHISGPLFRDEVQQAPVPAPPPLRRRSGRGVTCGPP